MRLRSGRVRQPRTTAVHAAGATRRATSKRTARTKECKSREWSPAVCMFPIVAPPRLQDDLWVMTVLLFVAFFSASPISGQSHASAAAAPIRQGGGGPAYEARPVPGGSTPHDSMMM